MCTQPHGTLAELRDSKTMKHVIASPECKAVNSRGEPVPGTYPIHMYDISAERMLTPNEFKCVATDGPL